jgi:hypothetical protein
MVSIPLVGPDHLGVRDPPPSTTTEHRRTRDGRAARRAVRCAVVAWCLLLAACGYRLAPADRTVRLAMQIDRAVHPDASPTLLAATARVLRDEGFRVVDAGDGPVLRLRIEDSAEPFAAANRRDDGTFRPAARRAALTVLATLHRPDGTAIDLGRFEGAGLERTADDPIADDLALSTAYDLAAREVALAVATALCAAW